MKNNLNKVFAIAEIYCPHYAEPIRICSGNKNVRYLKKSYARIPFFNVSCQKDNVIAYIPYVDLLMYQGIHLTDQFKCRVKIMSNNPRRSVTNWVTGKALFINQW